MFRSLFFPPPFSPLLPFPPSSLISFSFRPIAYNRVKRHGVYKSFSCRAYLSPSKEVSSSPSFSSSKTKKISIFFFFFLPRNRKSPEGMRDEREERTRKNERRGPSRQMSRDPAGFYDSRVINAARTSILISKLTKLEIRGGTRRFFGNAGTRSRATGVLLFAEAGLKQRKKGNAS